MSSRRICIVGLDSYGMLSGEENPKYIGGESIQHVLLARAWRDLGHDVSIIVHDEGQGARREIDGITAIAAHTRPGGLPGCDFFHPRATQPVSAHDCRRCRDLLPVSRRCLHRHHRVVLPRNRIAASSSASLRQRLREGTWPHPVLAGSQAVQLRPAARRRGRRADRVPGAITAREPWHRQHRGQHDGRTAARRHRGRKDIDVSWVSNLRSLKRPEPRSSPCTSCPT